MADPNHHSPLDRRTLLRGAGGGVVAATWLVGCGSDDDPNAAAAPTPASTTDGSGGGGGEVLVPTADVEVGGGVIIADTYVVTQPTKGDFKGFSAICTHQGCPVEEITGGEIVCNCHGSHYSIDDGSVVSGPATAPLPEQAITVEGGGIVLG